ncbi:DUF1524 domain-containing protein [Nesterenkonia sp.]|uniref:GmrSD restriction endonuclease domain-containing protein n=1 Tax=Nesterenkonia sp. TaxID=704201 RepID=UPI002619011B|nr:DUF1524 domain-containing protein [Nesterenkonia sp.]
MGVRRRRAFSTLTAAGLTAALLAPSAAPAHAYSSPAEVPNPFQDYSAQDYADALWNLETTTYVRTYERESHEDCDTKTYEVSHPLGLEPTRTYAHVVSEDGTWCHGSEGDELREAFDEREDEDEHFYHGVPYENTAQREPYFGTWADVTGNGVTSRTEIHARDTGSSTFSVSGTYYDHYNGEHVNIATTETHGEHMIPVGHTWPEMQERSREDRVAYYNDPMNLTSTMGPTNREKSGHPPSEWMPENEESWCAYAMTWTHIANKHRISLYGSDIDHLREQLYSCLEEELGDDGTLDPDQRSDDLDWQSLPPQSDPDSTEDVAGVGPRTETSGRDLLDAIWNLERTVRTRSVERESGEDCDLQTYTTTDPQGGPTLTYARAISPENTVCSGKEGRELREELEEKAEEDEHFFHIRPMDGNARGVFGYWQVRGKQELNTRNRVLKRDLNDVELNSAGTAVLSGTFYDPYTSEQEQLQGASAAVDHILPEEHAWIEIQTRDADQRRAYYNDRRNLLATTEESQQEKGSQAPRDWMPPHEGFHCRYAAAWVHTAARHSISLYSSDVRQLRETLYRCLVEQTDGEAVQETRRAGFDWPSLPPY